MTGQKESAANPRLRATHKWTPSARAKFLEALRETGNVSHSARSIGLGRSEAYVLRSTDPTFAVQWDEAIESSVDDLESVWRERAEKGIAKPVFQGGSQVGTVTEYPERMAMFFLKAYRRDKFGDQTTLEHRGAQSAAIQFVLPTLPGAAGEGQDGL